MAPQYRVTIERIESPTTACQVGPLATEVYRQTFENLHVPAIIRWINEHSLSLPGPRRETTPEEFIRGLENDARGKGKSV